MRTSQFDAEQRRFAALAVEAGWSVTDVCRAYGISRMTFYRWKAAEPAELDRQARALVAALQAAPLTTERLQAALEELGIGVEEARPVRRTRAMREAEDRELAERLVDLAKVRRGAGYRSLHAELVKEGYPVGPMRTYRVYIQAGLAVRRERGKGAIWSPDGGRIGPNAPVTRPHEVWDVLSAYGVTDQGLRFIGRRVSDAFTGEVLYHHAHHLYPHQKFWRVLAELAAQHGTPTRIHLEGANRDMNGIDYWARNNGVKVHGPRDRKAPMSAQVDWPTIVGPYEPRNSM